MPEIKNFYETVFILSMKLGDEGVAATVQKFKDLISANATIDGVDEWGKRRLAYEINKEADGYYTLIHFTSAPEFTAELDRIYNITEGVLRSLIIRREVRGVVPVRAMPAPVAAQAAAPVAVAVAAAPAPAVEAVAEAPAEV